MSNSAEMDEAMDEIGALSKSEILGHLRGTLSFSHQLRGNKNLLIKHVLASAPKEKIDFLRDLGRSKQKSQSVPVVLERTDAGKDLGEVGADVAVLTSAEIRASLKGVLPLSNELRTNKARLVEHVLASAPAEQLQLLQDLGKSKRASIQEARSVSRQAAKRKRADEQQERRVARRVEIVMTEESRNSQFEEEHDTSRYLQLPTDSEIKSCYRRFHEATSNSALHLSICGVCAREISTYSDKPSLLPLKDLPNSHRLVPAFEHPQHDLYDGLLLEPAGVEKDGNGVKVHVCRSCLHDLEKISSKPPALSLANNMWVGRVPWQLQVLTFAEQLLIALVYPRVYTFKLFPKKVGGTRDNLQRGMRGNVSSYELNMDGISDMLKGDLMPRPTAVLASVITITFIGVGELPKRTLWNTFRVRRQAVMEALRWLKDNNRKYYGSIEIDCDRLQALPEEDVPPEVIGIVRQSTDVGVVDQESDGYVPRDDAAPGEDTSDSVNPDDAPDVIPYTVSGAADTDLSKVTAMELMTWGLENIWKDGKEGAYAVRHGRKPANDFGRPLDKAMREVIDFDRPNFFERAFPPLFPFGTGGPEADRPEGVSFIEHIRWLLQYHDRRFRKHQTFPFVAFGIQQRRDSLGSARIQMRRRNFDSDAKVLSTITLEKLQEARIEEEKKLPISDPAVRLLKKHIHATGGRVMGSNQSRYQLRSQMWSTAIYISPPSLWITINPCDLHDPIAQVFAGEEINMDDFVKVLGPDKNQRAKNIADDPYASAKFFHFIIRTILETLFGIEVTPFQIRCNPGIYGRVSAYFGAVESQGRGSLHLHMIVWLKNAPTSDEMRDMLTKKEFRDQVKAFIRANIRAHIPGVETGEAVKQIPNETDIAYSRPPHPDLPNFDEQIQRYETQLARAKQVHTCELRRCIIYDEKGRPKCKRRAPFEYAEEEYIDEAGNWAPKRLYQYFNNWNPATLIHGRCNNDCKLLSNGKDTCNVGEYIFTYASKNQGKNHNMSALMAEGFAYHNQRPHGQDTLRDEQRLLIFRLVHIVNREQELAAPMVISYLMGWGDVYRSHHYTAIFWSSFSSALLKEFPGISPLRSRLVQLEPSVSTVEQSTVTSEGPNNAETEAGEEMVVLQGDSRGRLSKKCQVIDYALRGEHLEQYSVLRYFVDTYEVDYSQDKATASSEVNEDDVDNDIRHPHRGRRKNPRVRYHPSHPLWKTKQRVVRSHGHTNLPNFIGPYFPRRDDPEIYPFYCASMLVLLKPWRNIQKDLKADSESWESAFKGFMDSAPPSIHRIVSGIQYLHECKSAVQRDRASAGIADSGVINKDRDTDVEPFGSLDLDEDTPSTSNVISSFSEEGLQELITSMTPWGEKNHGRHAVHIAIQAKIFTDRDSNWLPATPHAPVANATGNDLQRLLEWRAQMDDNVNRLNGGAQPAPEGTDTSAKETGSVTRVESAGDDRGDVLHQERDAITVDSSEVREESIPPADPSELKEDQRRAYDIVIWHLDQTLSGAQPPPLRMILHGEGGTGKSKVIQTITQRFADRQASALLLKSAYTGVAASLIDGKTTHTIGMISQSGRPMSDTTKEKLQLFWKDCCYLIIDEFSMISKKFLAKLSKNIGLGKAKGNVDNPSLSNLDDSLSFGGINVILCGDLHQFPPVAGGRRDTLYFPSLSQDSIELQIGRKIYEEFQTVVVLREQVRVTDPEWREFLRRLRKGNVKEEDLTMLRQLLITNPDCTPTDFAAKPWSDLCLVTPRHAVRGEWNTSALEKHCKATGRQMFISYCEDTIRDRPLSIAERYAVALRSCGEGKKKKRNELPDAIQLAIGMKVMVTQNVETDLDITNGARGEIVDIILHPDEPPIGSDSVVHLTYPPSYILVKLQRTRVAKLKGLKASVIPIEPTSKTFTINIEVGGKSQQRTVRRRQLPMTAAYAFTDYRSQGQTIPYVLVDIATPPTGGISLFNLYVALSRSSGRTSIRLLRDFDNATFMAGHDPELLAEDDRLDHLDQQTKEWWQKVERLLGDSCEESN